MNAVKPDVRHADTQVVEGLDSFFETKADKRLDDWIAHFDPNAFYADAVLGWTYDSRDAPACRGR